MIFGASLIFILGFNSAFAAVARYPAEDKPAKYAGRDGCYLGVLDRFFEWGEKYSPIDAKNKTCQQYECLKDSSDVNLYTCGAYSAGDDCVKTEDFTKPYPDCCPQFTCPTTTSTTTEQPSDASAAAAASAGDGQATASAGNGQATASAGDGKASASAGEGKATANASS